MRPVHLGLLGVLAMLLLAACGGQVASQSSMPAAAPTAAPAAPMSDSSTRENAAIEESPGEPAAAGGANPEAQIPQQQRLVIKNAYVSIQVENVNEAEATLRTRAEALGGYVVSVQTNGSGDYQSTSIVFRVPAAQFETALSGVEGLAKRVLSRNVSGDDVTEEFVDLESRLRNLEATRERLLDLLNRATQVEDALEVNRALTDVQGEIEQIRGRMQYLQQSAAFSTISADLQLVPPPPAIVDEEGWEPLRVARVALRDLVEFGQGLVELAIVILIWIPVWGPMLLLARWAWRRFVRPGKAGTPPAPPAPDTP